MTTRASLQILNETFFDRSASPHAQMLMRDCMDALGDDGIIAWYPSADNDARAVIELGPARRQLHGFQHRPTLIIHTSLPVELHCHRTDYRTAIRAQEHADFLVSEKLRAYVNDALFDDRRPGEPSRGSIELVKGTSRRFGESTQWVMNLELSNWDFFLNVVAKRGVRFQTLIRVREGSGLGGCSLSTSYFFPWLYWAGCREVITDDMVWADQEQHEKVCGWMAERGQTTTPPRFRFTPIGEAFEWSELDVSPWKLEPQEGTLQSFQDWGDSLPWQRGRRVASERMEVGSDPRHDSPGKKHEHI
jgi:hypothetical protein